MAEDASARINELTTVNVNLSSMRVKLEQELSVYAADFEEASKELKVSHLLPKEILYLAQKYKYY